MAGLSIETAEGARPGEAILTVRLAGATVTAPANLRCAIRRSGYETPNLGPDGWQVPEVLLVPGAVQPIAEGLQILLGPDIVQHMERGNYQVALSGGGLAQPVAGAMTWRVRAFVAARKRGAGRLGNVAAPELTEEELHRRARLEESEPTVIIPWKTAQVVTPPEPEVPPVDESTATDTVIVPRIPSQPEEPTVIVPREPALPPPPPPPLLIDRIEPLKPPVDEESAEEKRRKKKRPRILLPILGAIAGLALLAGSGIGLYLYLNPGCPRNALADAQQFLTGNPSAQMIYDKALACQQCGAVDASIVLLRRAADNGFGPAAHALGRIYDPMDFSPPGSDRARALQMPEANPLFAGTWYQRAIAAGDASAQPDLDRLVDWAKQAAAKGDDRAGQLLRMVGK